MKHYVPARESHPGAEVKSHDGKIILSYVVVSGLILFTLYALSAGQVPDGTDFSTIAVLP